MLLINQLYMYSMPVHVGPWAQLECGNLLPEEFAKEFSKLIKTTTRQDVNMENLLPSLHNALVQPYPEVIMALECIRAEGLKTALLTNNWLVEKGKTFMPVDSKYFDVVRPPFLIWF